MELSAAIAHARNALQEGNSREAIHVYKELLKDRPDDIRLQEKFGDLLREDGQLAAATWTYRSIANYWEHEGYFLRATVVHQKLLRCERDDVSTRRRLVTLYERLQLRDKALEELLRLAEIHAASGHEEEQLQMLRSGLELQPSNIEVRLQLVRVLQRHEQLDEVITVLADGLDCARRKMDADAYLKLGPRYLKLQPDDHAVARRMELLIEAERRKPGAGTFVGLEDTEEQPVMQVDLVDSLTTRPFSLSSEALLEAPDHPVCHAIRTRRHGDALETLRLLDSGSADDYPYAAMFERSVALIELSKYQEALPHLELLSILPVVNMQDRELVWFYIATALEGLKEYERAQRWLERIETTSPGQSPEVAERLARYQSLI